MSALFVGQPTFSIIRDYIYVVYRQFLQVVKTMYSFIHSTVLHLFCVQARVQIFTSYHTGTIPQNCRTTSTSSTNTSKSTYRTVLTLLFMARFFKNLPLLPNDHIMTQKQKKILQCHNFLLLSSCSLICSLFSNYLYLRR